MLQNAQQELVRGNKALSLTETIGVGEGLLFVVHLWVRCHLLSFFPSVGFVSNWGASTRGDANVPDPTWDGTKGDTCVST